MPKSLRVLVVDDSAFIRSSLVRMLESEPSIAVVGSAKNGAEGLDLARALKPDVITLDLEMPVMDGLQTLTAIMEQCPVPVIMLSAHTAPGAELTLKALRLGAADFLVKPGTSESPELFNIRDELVVRVLALACKYSGPTARSNPDATGPRRSVRPGGFPLVAIGASTGGPQALQRLLARLPADLDAAVLIAQHMPRLFTRPFAERLNQEGPLRVREAENGDVLQPGLVLMAPGDSNLELLEVREGQASVRVGQGPRDVIYRPSVDALFRSVARLNGPHSVGVILTGMGTDGCEGLAELHAAGGVTLAQEEGSCVVYGMPRACVEAGVVERILPLEAMPAAILNALGEPRQRTARSAA